MAKKSLGYLELQWTCPNCGGINPGSGKTCTQCGAPQPKNVQFEQVKGGELTQDEAVAARVKVGPDIHCPYCGARNPGDAKVCSQCGGDLVSGERRASGRVLGAYEKGAVEKRPCPHCGAENPETARICAKCGGSMRVESPENQISEPITESPQPLTSQAKKRLPVGLIIVLVAICAIAAVFIIFARRTESITGTVDNVRWERSVTIEGLVPVEYRNWLDQIPSDAEVLTCKSEVRSVESEMQPNAEEVCGTPYSVDTGSGYAEVIQDCEYYVYDDYCTYSVTEWGVVDTATISGNDFYPEWPEPVLSAGQRLGDQAETYVIDFNAGKENYSYTINDYESFQRFQIGTNWNLEVNALGGVVSVEP